MTDNEEKDLGMKKAKVMTVIQVILCFIAYASLGVGVVLQKNGVSEASAVRLHKDGCVL